MDYYKMKRNVGLDVKNFLMQVTKTAQEGTPSPKWKDFKIEMFEKYGIDERFLKKTLSVYALDVDKNGKFTRIKD